MDAMSVAPCASLSTSGVILSADDPFLDLLAGDARDLVGQRLASLAHAPADGVSIAECLATVANTGACAHVRVRMKTPDGRDVDTRLVVSPSSDETLSVVVIDETARLGADREVARLQRRWLSLLRSSTEIVFTVDAAGDLTSVTSALPERLGWAVEDVVGRSGISFVHPDDQRRALQAWHDVSSGTRTQDVFEARLLDRHGDVAWCRLMIRDLRDDPDVLAVVGNVTDITEQKQQERRRRLQEARFRARFDQSRLPQLLHARDGSYEVVNDAMCALLGRSREDLIGLPAGSITHPDDPGDIARIFGELLRGDIEWGQVEAIIADADGQPIPVRVDLTLLRDADGNPDGCAASLQDLRPLRDSERARSELQRTFDVVAARSRDFIALHDAQGRTVYASPAGLPMFGEFYNASSRDQWQLVHPDDLAAAQRHWQMVLSQPESHTWRYRARDAAGDWMWVEQTSTNLLDTGAAVVVTVVRDVTSQVESAEALRVSEARYRAIAETAEEGILVIAPHGMVTYANARIAAILGLEPSIIREHEVWSVFDGRTAELVENRVKNRVTRGAERYELPYLHPDGTWRALLVAASPMPEADGLPQGSLAMISDITEQRRSERELRHAAEHDELTGLLNRTTLMTHLRQAEAEGTAVLFIDLDHFKDVNDGRGHTAGDDVLIQVAARLRATLRADDVIARFGGDEFVVVLHDADEDRAQLTARRLLEALSQTYRVGRHAFRIGATIGIALSPAPSADDLLRFADTAMYAAKASGRGRYRLFDVALAEQAEERYSLGSDLLAALADDALDMHYQPVIDISTGRVDGVEALARWDHPTRGLIAPSRFVALAELTASSADLDRWVLRRAMSDIAALKADGTMAPEAKVGINLSGQSLSEGLDTFVIATAQQAGLKPEEISLEITESAIMFDKDVAISVLQRLRDHGFDIAIDDFGTGYSSMAYLRDLPITVLKIDRGFVRGIPDDAHLLAIVTALIELARSLDLTVIAEGVENAGHLAALRERGCGYAQGWLWSPALSLDQLRETGILSQTFDVDGVADGSA